MQVECLGDEAKSFFPECGLYGDVQDAHADMEAEKVSSLDPDRIHAGEMQDPAD